MHFCLVFNAKYTFCNLHTYLSTWRLLSSFKVSHYIYFFCYFHLRPIKYLTWCLPLRSTKSWYYIFISVVESQIEKSLLKNRKKNSNNSITTFFFQISIVLHFLDGVWCEKLSHYWQFSDWKSYSYVDSLKSRTTLLEQSLTFCSS